MAWVGTYYQVRVTVEGCSRCHIAKLTPLPVGIEVVENEKGFALLGLPAKAAEKKAYRFYEEEIDEKNKHKAYHVVEVQLEVKEKASVFLTKSGTSEPLPNGVLGHEYSAALIPAIGGASVKGCPATPTAETARAAGSMGFTLATDAVSPIALSTAKLADAAGSLSNGKLGLQFYCKDWATASEAGIVTVEIDTEEKTYKAARVDDFVAGVAEKEFKRIFGDSTNNPCLREYNDCDWRYTALAGFEQSQLASQESQTNPLVDLILRSPIDSRKASIWMQARFLGAPSGSTSNISSAVSDPTGTLTSAALSQIGSAVDYVVGLQSDVFRPGGTGAFTVGIIGAFGATSPITERSGSIGYVMPGANTPECTTLLGKYPQLTDAKGQYRYSSNDVVTTTVGSTTTASAPFCLVNKAITQSTVESGTTTTISGVGIVDLVQSSAGRSGLLLKYVAGVRLIDRFHMGTSTHCAPENASRPTDGPCLRKLVDFTLGQDEAIAGGRFRGMVFKSEILLPIKQTGLYFFGTAAIRLRKNQTKLLEAPLILTPVPISSTTNTGTSAVVFPSPSVAVVQQAQSDKDFYRIGLALNLEKVFTSWFK